MSESQGTVTLKVYGSGAEGCQGTIYCRPTLPNSNREASVELSKVTVDEPPSIGTILRLSVPQESSARFGMGCTALTLMLIAEFGFVLWIRGLSIKTYFSTRDPVSGAAYYLAMPLLIGRV